MIKVYIKRKNQWKPAKSQPVEIKRGKNKGKYRVKIFTGTARTPDGLTTVIVTKDELDEDETTQERQTPAIVELKDTVKRAVKYGNGLQQAQLFANAQQRSLF